MPLSKPGDWPLFLFSARQGRSIIPHILLPFNILFVCIVL